MKVNIKDAISEYNMITSGDHVVVALSGGADSVSLLIALDMLKDELQIQLSACHINHNLRGLESDNDEMFVRELCEKRDITLEVFSVDINSLKEKHKSIEETAREARYKCFESFGENVKIATAHTASDNVETVIFNMVRGTALKGLCGIPAVRGNIIRPLIYSSREDVLKFLSDNKQDYVNDNSNFSDIYSRNKIRLNVLPELRQINPSLESGFINMCKALKSDEGFLSELSENGLNDFTYCNNQ